MDQSTKYIFSVRPACFGFNYETETSNAFQEHLTLSADELKQDVLREFEGFVEKLRSKGVSVLVFDDTPNPAKPDAIFPNNWISLHGDGTVILYPMNAANRRAERRADIVDTITKQFKVRRIIDLTTHEEDGKFLEGTGSVVFDHDNKTAYASLSPRTDRELFIELCTVLGYKPVCFHSHDRNGKEIYHTNVMMSIAENFAVLCGESIRDDKEKALVTRTLIESGHEIVDISFDQLDCFAGNMLALRDGDDNNLVVLSERSFNSLIKTQRDALEKWCELITVAIDTIETVGGGSVRCMIAEIFLEPKREII